MARQQERVADGIYRYVLQPKGGKKAEVRYGATVWIRGAWGDRTQRRKEGFAREKDAKAWRAQQMADSAAGLATAGGDVKLGVWVEKYLALHAGRWSHGTVRNEGNVIRWFSPLFHLALNRITPALVAARLVELQQQYKPSSVRSARRAFSQCLKQAVDFGLLARNPVLATKAPPPPQSEIDYWTAEQVGTLLAAVADDPETAVLLRILAECWLRVGELCALTWADVDLGRRELRVARTITEGPAGPVVGTRAKTARSARTLPLSDDLARLLRERQDRDRLGCGRAWSASRFVFQRDDHFMDRTHVWRVLRDACALAGLPRIYPHHLRHSGASIALRGDPERGIRPLDPKVVQERLGHTSVKFTYDRYVSTNEADHRAAAETFAELLKGAM